MHQNFADALQFDPVGDQLLTLGDLVLEFLAKAVEDGVRHHQNPSRARPEPPRPSAINRLA